MSEIKVVEIGHPSAAEPAFKFQSDGSVLVWDTGTSTYVPLDSGAANFSNTATGTYTDGGVDYKYITFTGSGTLTVTKSGFADILVVGGGGSTYGSGGTAFGGGGAGGMVEKFNIYVPTGSHTVTVGGADNHSAALGVSANRGGAGGNNATGEWVNGHDGGSGGGSATTNAFTYAGAAVDTTQGNSGGKAGPGAGGGAGGAASSNTPGTGKASSLTGTSVTYAAGGTGNGNANGAANTGNGAGGGNGRLGGSGIVVVRVKV